MARRKILKKAPSGEMWWVTAGLNGRLGIGYDEKEIRQVFRDACRDMRKPKHDLYRQVIRLYSKPEGLPAGLIERFPSLD